MSLLIWKARFGNFISVSLSRMICFLIEVPPLIDTLCNAVLGDWALDSSDIPLASSVAPDSPLSDSASQSLRVGQIPSWLNQELLGIQDEHSGMTVEAHHHSDIWVDRTLNKKEMSGEKGASYREKSLPTFNSFVLQHPRDTSSIARSSWLLASLLAQLCDRKPAGQHS